MQKAVRCDCWVRSAAAECSLREPALRRPLPHALCLMEAAGAQHTSWHPMGSTTSSLRCVIALPASYDRIRGPALAGGQALEA